MKLLSETLKSSPTWCMNYPLTRRVIPHLAASERSCDFWAFEGRPTGLDNPYVARQVCWAADSFANRVQIPHFFATSLTDALRLAPAGMLAFAETKHDSCFAVMLMNLDEPPFPWADTPEIPMPLSESDNPMTPVAITFLTLFFNFSPF